MAWLFLFARNFFLSLPIHQRGEASKKKEKSPSRVCTRARASRLNISFYRNIFIYFFLFKKKVSEEMPFSSEKWGRNSNNFGRNANNFGRNSNNFGSYCHKWGRNFARKTPKKRHFLEVF